MMAKTNSKTLKALISSDKDLKSFVSALRSSKDKKLIVELNNFRTTLPSLTTQKKFAEGLEYGYSIAMGQSKVLFKNMLGEINQLKSLLSASDKKDEERKNSIDELRKIKNVTSITVSTYKDKIAELEEDRLTLHDKLVSLEPIIKLIKAKKLEQAYGLYKKYAK